MSVSDLHGVPPVEPQVPLGAVAKAKESDADSVGAGSEKAKETLTGKDKPRPGDSAKPGSAAPAASGTGFSEKISLMRSGKYTAEPTGDTFLKDLNKLEADLTKINNMSWFKRMGSKESLRLEKITAYVHANVDEKYAATRQIEIQLLTRMFPKGEAGVSIPEANYAGAALPEYSSFEDVLQHAAKSHPLSEYQKTDINTLREMLKGTTTDKEKNAVIEQFLKLKGQLPDETGIGGRLLKTAKKEMIKNIKTLMEDGALTAKVPHQPASFTKDDVRSVLPLKEGTPFHEVLEHAAVDTDMSETQGQHYDILATELRRAATSDEKDAKIKTFLQGLGQLPFFKKKADAAITDVRGHMETLMKQQDDAKATADAAAKAAADAKAAAAKAADEALRPDSTPFMEVLEHAAKGGKTTAFQKMQINLLRNQLKAAQPGKEEEAVHPIIGKKPDAAELVKIKTALAKIESLKSESPVTPAGSATHGAWSPISATQEIVSKYQGCLSDINEKGSAAKEDTIKQFALITEYFKQLERPIDTDVNLKLLIKYHLSDLLGKPDIDEGIINGILPDLQKFQQAQAIKGFSAALKDAASSGKAPSAETDKFKLGELLDKVKGYSPDLTGAVVSNIIVPHLTSLGITPPQGFEAEITELAKNLLNKLMGPPVPTPIVPTPVVVPAAAPITAKIDAFLDDLRKKNLGDITDQDSAINEIQVKVLANAADADSAIEIYLASIDSEFLKMDKDAKVALIAQIKELVKYPFPVGNPSLRDFLDRQEKSHPIPNSPEWQAKAALFAKFQNLPSHMRTEDYIAATLYGAKAIPDNTLADDARKIALRIISLLPPVVVAAPVKPVASATPLDALDEVAGGELELEEELGPEVVPDQDDLDFVDRKAAEAAKAAEAEAAKVAAAKAGATPAEIVKEIDAFIKLIPFFFVKESPDASVKALKEKINEKEFEITSAIKAVTFSQKEVAKVQGSSREIEKVNDQHRKGIRTEGEKDKLVIIDTFLQKKFNFDSSEMERTDPTSFKKFQDQLKTIRSKMK
jgi:hypothetical protein